jgi:hypothetical protein
MPAYRQDNTNTLYRCNHDEWCCSAGGNETSCCNDPNVSLFNVYGSNITNGSAWATDLALLPVSQGQTTSAGSASTIISIITRTTTKTETSIAPNASWGLIPNGPGTTTIATSSSRPSAAGTNKEATRIGVGVGVGAGVGVPMFASLAGVWFLWSKERRANRELRLQLRENTRQQRAHDEFTGWQDRVFQRELPDTEVLKELQGTARAEM